MNKVINLYKPQNISSHQAVSAVKRFFRVKKAGHAGTLDPLATGVLIVCLDEATKITRFICDLEKEYRAGIKFGERTDTFDSTGKATDRSDMRVDMHELRETLPQFLGAVRQVPPMYSAVKVDGSPLYRLARQGVEVQREAREIRIEEIELLSFEFPYADLRIRCSKGTYIRSLCDEIGLSLGTFAHMSSLERTRVGDFKCEDAVRPNELGSKKSAFHTIDSALSHLSSVVLGETALCRAMNGVSYEITAEELDQLHLEKTNQYVRLKTPEGLLFGIGKLKESRISIERLIHQDKNEDITEGDMLCP